MAIKIYTLNKNLGINNKNDEIFRQICGNEYIELAKWLYSLNENINVHANNEYALNNARTNNHIYTPQWLIYLDDNKRLFKFIYYVIPNNLIW